MNLFYVDRIYRVTRVFVACAYEKKMGHDEAVIPAWEHRGRARGNSCKVLELSFFYWVSINAGTIRSNRYSLLATYIRHYLLMTDRPRDSPDRYHESRP